MKSRSSPWSTVSRVLAAVVGGYGFTYAFTAALARVLPLDKADAMVSATLLSFAVYTLVMLWVFTCHNHWRAWAGLATAVPLAGIGFWPQLLERLA
ncbi:iron transporter [Pseudomonas syringae]|nr:iron transporter [Pseudomonas syringae]